MQIERLRSLIRESVKDHIKEIEAVAEAAAMDARLAEYDKAIKTCEEKIQTAENLEEVKDLMDTGKLNELKKKLKDLKSKKEKLERQKAKKNKGKEVTTDAETDKMDEAAIEEGPGPWSQNNNDTDDMENMNVEETYTMDEMDMKDEALNESFLKMQKLAGVITEAQFNEKLNVNEQTPPPSPGSPENLIRPLKSVLQDLIKRAEELEADSEKEPYFVAGKGYVSQEVDNVAENVHRLKNIAKNLLDPKGFEAMKTGVYNLQYTKK